MCKYNTLLVFLIVAILVFAGCTNKVNPVKQPAISLPASTIASVDSSLTASDSNIHVTDMNLSIAILGYYSCELAKYISVFVESNPDVNITFIQYQHNHDEECTEEMEFREYEEFIRSTCQKIASGEIQTDLIMYDSFYAKEFLDDGLLADMSSNDVITGFFNNPNLLDGIKRLCVYDEKIIGIPLNIFYAGCIINKNLCNKIGITIPQNSWNQDDLFKMATVLAEYNKTAETKAYLFTSNGEVRPYANLRRGLYQNDSSQPIFSSIEFIDYMEKVKQIDDMGLTYVLDHFEQSGAAMLRDDVLLYEIAYSDLHNYEKSIFAEHTILPVQTVAGNPPYTNASLLAISANPSNPALANAFIAGFLREEYQYIHAFEIQLYKDAEEYDILSTYSKATHEWIRTVTENSVPLYISRDISAWIDTVELPQGTFNNINFKEWAARMQEEAVKLSE